MIAYSIVDHLQLLGDLVPPVGLEPTLEGF